MHIAHDQSVLPAQQPGPQSMDALEAASNGIFLLIDASQYPGIRRVMQYRFRRLAWTPLSEPGQETDLDPILIHVASNQTRTLAWFLEHMRGMHCVSWIASSLPLPELRAHLAALARIESEDGTEYAMRFYDTRVLPAWYQALDAAQERRALGPITSWTYIDRDGTPCTLFGHDIPVVESGGVLRLTRQQEQSLLEAALPDLVLQRLEENGNADLAALSPTQRYAFVADQVNKARHQYHIQSMSEIVMFCSLALAIGRNFDKLMPVAQVLKRFAANPSSASGLSALRSA